MSTIAERLDTAVRAVAPITGVSIGQANDRSTWRIDFTQDATDEQKAAAQAALEAFDPTEPEPAPLTPDEKLKAFFASNPDVGAYVFGA